MPIRLSRAAALTVVILCAASLACTSQQPAEPAPPASNVAPKTGVEDVSATMPYDFVALDFVDASNGWIAGIDEGNNVSTILRTADGGRTWSQQVEIVGDTLFDVDFADVANGWAVGIEGTIYRTSDAGTTWSIEAPDAWAAQRETPFKKIYSQSTPATFLELSETVVSIFFVDATNGWAAGDTPTDDVDRRARLLLRTADGGKTWREIAAASPETDVALNDIFFVDANEGWAAGGNVVTREEDVLLHTTDGGKTWSRVATGAVQYQRAVHFADARTGWVVGLTIDAVSEEFGPSRILATADGGKTWTAQLTSERSFFDVHFADAQRGWAVGDRATVFTTADGGKTWSQQTAFDRAGSRELPRPRAQQNAPLPRSLNSVYGRDAKTAWVGGAGIILKRKE